MDKLLETIKQVKTLAGNDENKVVAEINEHLTKVKENANEVMHTANTGFGAELIPDDVLLQEILDMVPQHAGFLGALKGYHGSNMGKSVTVPIIGDIPYAIGMPERTSDALAHKQAISKLPTDKVTITQQTIYTQIDVSRQELMYSVADLEPILKRKIAATFAKTAESAILNADATNTATGNINCDDAQPSVTFTAGLMDHRLLFDNGLRKTFLSGTVDVDYADIGALSWANLVETKSLLGEYSFDEEDMLLLMNTATYNKVTTLDQYVNKSINGQQSTVITGKVPDDKISGVPLFRVSSYPKTEADGKVSATPANNTKGGFLYMKNQAVQYGYGGLLDMETYKIVGQGISIVAAMDFGFAVVNKKAQNTDPRVVGGINVTL